MSPRRDGFVEIATVSQHCAASLVQVTRHDHCRQSFGTRSSFAVCYASGRAAKRLPPIGQECLDRSMTSAILSVSYLQLCETSKNGGDNDEMEHSGCPRARVRDERRDLGTGPAETG